jgi:hypothetical protein
LKPTAQTSIERLPQSGSEQFVRISPQAFSYEHVKERKRPWVSINILQRTVFAIESQVILPPEEAMKI